MPPSVDHREPQPSIRRYLREAIVPHTLFDFALLALIAAWPFALYFDAARELPTASLATRTPFVIYDTQYFDAFHMLGRYHGGESAVLEHAGEGFFSFPLPPFVVPALLMRLFGIGGLYASVGVLLWLAVVAGRVMLRCMGLASGYARAAVAVLVVFPWAQYATFDGTQMLNLWMPRFGRPLGTAPQLMLSLAILALLARSAAHRTRTATWATLAAAVALTIQGDLHSGLTLALIASVAWAACLVDTLHRRASIRPLATASAVAAVVGLFALSPFLVARVLESPDAPAHLGRMPLSRLHPFIDTGAIVPYLGLAIVFAIAVAGVAWRDRRRDSQPDHAFAVARFLPAVLVLSYVALPVSIVLLGQGAQLFHFRDTIRNLTTITFIYGLFLTIQTLAPAGRRAIAAVGWLSLTVPAAALAWMVIGLHNMRPSPRDEGPMPPGWRDAFVAVNAFLQSPQNANAVVIGTFDPNVYPIWCGMMGRHAYCSDILTTTLPDAITERRLMELDKLLSMSDADVLRQLTSNDVINETLFYRLGQGKYTATRAYSLAPIDQYTPEDQRSIRAASRDLAWNLVMPIGERERLMSLYRSVDADHLSGRLDVIVLRDTDLANGMHAPPADRFEPVFDNAFYHVWRRRGL